MKVTRTPSALLALALVTGLTVSCTELLEAAGTITFGNPDIPLLEMTQDNGQALTWPSVGSLVGLSEDDLAAIPGMPSTLDNGTFAHLQGALRITGECFMDGGPGGLRHRGLPDPDHLVLRGGFALLGSLLRR